MKQFSKTYNSILVILFVLLSLNACKKTDSPSTVLTPGDYIYQRTGDYSGIRVFTHDGEVKDQKLIGYYTNVLFSTVSPVGDTAKVNDTFHVLSQTNLAYRYFGSNGNNSNAVFSSFTISKIDNYYQFTGTDTLTNVYFTSKFDSFYSQIGKHQPYSTIKYHPIPVENGINSIAVENTFKCFIASVSNNTLVFPLLRYLRINNIPGSTIGGGYFESIINNVFNLGSLHYLSPSKSGTYTYTTSSDSIVIVHYSIGDTLVTQTLNAYYSR